MKFKPDIIKVQVLMGLQGPDEIHLTLGTSSTFPSCQYEAVSVIKTEKGYGVSYCHNVLDLDPEVIHCDKPKAVRKSLLSRILQPQVS